MFGLVDLSGKAARKRFRQSIKDEWGCCAYCGKNQIHLTLDHIRPRVRGGSSMRSNLIPACVQCNSQKGSAEWKAWFEAQAFFSAARAARIEVWTKPRTYEVWEHWFLAGGNDDSECRLDTGTKLLSSSNSSGSAVVVSRRAYRSVTRLLGGEVQAEANLCCE